MDNFFYILIGVLWVAISLYNKSEKKKKLAQQKAAPEKPASDPLTVLRELILEETSEKPKPTFIPVEVQRPQKTKKTTERAAKYSKYDFRDDAGSYFNEGEKTTPQIKTNESEESLGENYLDEFDLKKAMIYSEIMRAPYI